MKKLLIIPICYWRLLNTDLFRGEQGLSESRLGARSIIQKAKELGEFMFFTTESPQGVSEKTLNHYFGNMLNARQISLVGIEFLTGDWDAVLVYNHSGGISLNALYFKEPSS